MDVVDSSHLVPHLINQILGGVGLGLVVGLFIVALFEWRYECFFVLFGDGLEVFGGIDDGIIIYGVLFVESLIEGGDGVIVGHVNEFNFCGGGLEGVVLNLL